MKISILIQLNKINKHNNDAIKEYTKRLSRYCTLQIMQLKTSQNLTTMIPSNALLIGISNIYDTITSTTLASTIAQFGVQGQSSLCFIITDDIIVLNSCQKTLSISKLVISDGLTLVTLLEQIYRSYRINLNQAYHK